MKTAVFGRYSRANSFLFFLIFFCAFALMDSFTCRTAFAQKSELIAGITEPINDVTLSLSVPGIVSKIFVREGDQVSKGQILLHLDKRAEELEVFRRKVIWQSKAEEEGAIARAQTLKEIYESTLNLYEATKSVSAEELKKSHLEFILAVAERDRIASAEKREKIEYDIALEILEKRNLRSPVDGIVIKLFYEVGESCEEHQPLVRAVDTSRGRFVCNLDESVGRMLKKGQEVDLMIGSGLNPAPKKGVVSFISPVVDSASGLMEVKVEFDNEDGTVRPGLAGAMVFDLP
ncbi:MAG TPA: efflux RND transporter periplasmic adaptor subunit [Desulfobacteraceae bacterium]|nr:efflux RND transporter periplasmic adaptor subunit [Desulfobacteraceae bacterium]